MSEESKMKIYGVTAPAVRVTLWGAGLAAAAVALSAGVVIWLVELAFS